MKIAVIGGAGVRTVLFVNGLLKRYRKLKIEEVALFDTDAEKLEVIGGLCRYVVRRGGEQLRIVSAETPQEALTGADYVVTTVRVGGDHSRVIDETVALEHDVIGQETTGVGGFSMAARTIPVLLDYCRLIRRVAPDAWIFNFSNPSGLVTQALSDAGYDRVIGICDAPSSVAVRMAQTLGVAREALHLTFFGLNHLSWISSVKIAGQEIQKRLLADDGFLRSVREFSIFDPELIRMLGLLPNEYLYYYYHREQALAHMRKAGVLRGQTIEMLNRAMMEKLRAIDLEREPERALQTFLSYMQLRENSYMSTEAGVKARELQMAGSLAIPEGIGYADVMLDCVEGLQSTKGRELVLSVPNRGSIKGLSDTDIVEVTCRVDAGGIHPLPIGEPPEDCGLLIRLVKQYERLAARAIRFGEADTAVRALMLHPLVNSYSLAKKVLDAYGEAYGRPLVGEKRRTQ